MSSIKDKLSATAERIYRRLDLILPKDNGELLDAVRYSSISDGKCIRGFLVVEFCNLFNVGEERGLILACIIELIHSFSLVHDDLPALDNSDTRRGKDSCHRKFSESTAILAGDAILVIAYNLLGEYFPSLVSFSSKYILEMINGQVCDLESKIEKISINRMKTGAMFALSCSWAPCLMNAEKGTIDKTNEFGYNFGILFQHIDDVDDGDDIRDEKIIRNSIDCIESYLQEFISIKDIVDQLLHVVCSRIHCKP